MSEPVKPTVSYASYGALAFDRPARGVLRITLNRPERLNALDARGHDELARVWRDVDEDEQTSAVILCGAGRAFSAGGDFDMVEEMIESFDARVRVWRESKDLVYNIINCSARDWSPRCSRIYRSRRVPRNSSTGIRASASQPAIMRRLSGRSCAAWRRRSIT